MLRKIVAALLCAGMVFGSAGQAFAYVGSSFSHANITAAAPYQDSSPKVSYLNYSNSGSYAMTSSVQPTTGNKFRLQAVFRLTADTPLTSSLNVTFDPATGAVGSGSKKLTFRKAGTLYANQIDFSFRQGVSGSLDLGNESVTLRDNRKYVATENGVVYVYDQSAQKVITVTNGAITAPANSGYTLEQLFTDYYVTLTVPITVARKGNNDTFTPNLQARMRVSDSDYVSAPSNGYVSIFTYTDTGANVVCKSTSSSSSGSSSGYFDGEAENIEDAIELFQDGASDVAVYLSRSTISSSDVRDLKKAISTGDTLTVYYDDLMVVFTGSQVKRFPTGESITFGSDTDRNKTIYNVLRDKRIDCEFLTFDDTNPTSVKGEIHLYTSFYDRVYIYSVASDGESAKYVKYVNMDGDDLVFEGALSDYFFTEEKLSTSELNAVNNALDPDQEDEEEDDKGSSGTSSSSSTIAAKIASVAKQAVKNKKDTVNLVYTYSGGTISSTVIKALDTAYRDSGVNVKLYLQTRDSKNKTVTQYLVQGKYVYRIMSWTPDYSYSKQSNGDVKISVGKKGSTLGSLTYIASTISKSGLNTSKLTLLKKDAKTGKYSVIPRKCTVDSGGYFHFSVLNGGDYVITDTPKNYL